MVRVSQRLKLMSRDKFQPLRENLIMMGDGLNSLWLQGLLLHPL